MADLGCLTERTRGFVVKILHVLANGPPDVNGYAIRTHGLMKAYY